MKLPATLFASLLLLSSHYGTVQVHDALTYNSEKGHLQEYPLLPVIKQRKLTFDSISSANLKGFIAVWTIRDGRLFLSDFSGRFEGEDRDVQWLFPKTKGLVPAKWYSGTLHLGLGDARMFLDPGHFVVTDRLVVFEVTNGVVTRTHTQSYPKNVPVMKAWVAKNLGFDKIVEKPIGDVDPFVGSPRDRKATHKRNGEQGDARRPATATDSKSKDKEKPKPEPEGRSQTMSIALPIVIFVAWFAACLAPAGGVAIEDALAGVPGDNRRGTSILPGFPLVPIFMWGLAWALDLAIAPWGSITFLALHLALLGFAVFVIVRNVVRLRLLETIPAEQGGDDQPAAGVDSKLNEN